MNDEKTITDIKTTFIRSQTRLLSAPVKPSPSWQDNVSLAEDEAPLSNKIVEDITTKVNNKIKSHNRLVFSSQSQRHVAEQIDSLHWNEAIAEDAKIDHDTTWIKQDVNLYETDAAKTLPERYEDLLPGQDLDVSPERIQEYEELRSKLVGLVRRRDEQKQKLATYRRLKQLLEPFEDAQQNIQPNLVTRDGELSKELERMRMLVARVTSRANNMKSLAKEAQTESSEMTNEDKLAHVLGLG